MKGDCPVRSFSTSGSLPGAGPVSVFRIAGISRSSSIDCGGSGAECVDSGRGWDRHAG
jgi:hypothetical protein